MARLEDIPEPTRTAVEALDCPSFPTTPFVAGPALAMRRVAIVTSAALIQRGAKPLAVGSPECRALDRHADPADLLISHVSINFDRSGFQRDVNVVYPIDRLRDLARDGVIGSVADTHFTVMGSTDPTTMEPAVDQMAGVFAADKVDAILLTPV